MLQKLVRNVANGVSHNAESSILTVISPNVRIVGDIVSQGSVHVDGEIDGNLTCQSLTVGEGARISGEVTAESVKVHGILNGKINSPTISIARTAKVSGDLFHETLEIEMGAYFEGHCIRRPNAPPTEVKRIENAVPAPSPAPAESAPVANAPEAKENA